MIDNYRERMFMQKEDYSCLEGRLKDQKSLVR